MDFLHYKNNASNRDVISLFFRSDGIGYRPCKGGAEHRDWTRL